MTDSLDNVARPERGGHLSEPFLLGLAERWESGLLYRLSYWLSLPWRCRIIGHDPTIREWYDGDGYILEERYRECERCQHWMGHA